MASPHWPKISFNLDAPLKDFHELKINLQLYTILEATSLLLILLCCLIYKYLLTFVLLRFMQYIQFT